MSHNEELKELKELREYKKIVERFFEAAQICIKNWKEEDEDDYDEGYTSGYESCIANLTHFLKGKYE